MFRFTTQRARKHRVPCLAGALLILATAALPFVASAQVTEEVDATQQRLDQLVDLLEKDAEKLSRAQLRTKAGLQEVDRLNREIALRRELVRTYEKRRGEIELLRDSLQARLELAESDLNELRTEYGRRATHAYKYGRIHSIALIVAAESINQMLVRVRYLKRFADQRRDRLQMIQSATEYLEAERERLERTYKQTDELIANARAEESELEKAIADRRKTINSLKRAESNLKNSIAEREAAVAEVESKLSQMIAASRGRGGAASTGPDLTGPFVENKGKLPWPSIGVVREPFGEIVNEELGTKTPNPGIFIATSPQAEIKSVFGGTVISVDVMIDFGTYVIVQHGSYHSVYGNFSVLYVGQGEQVPAGHTLGRSGTDAEPKGEGVFFAIFKDGQPIDPTPWLGRP